MFVDRWIVDAWGRFRARREANQKKAKQSRRSPYQFTPHLEPLEPHAGRSAPSMTILDPMLPFAEMFGAAMVMYVSRDAEPDEPTGGIVIAASAPPPSVSAAAVFPEDHAVATPTEQAAPELPAQEVREATPHRAAPPRWHVDVGHGFANWDAVLTATLFTLGGGGDRRE